MNHSPLLDDLLCSLPDIHAVHGPYNPVYLLLMRAARREVERLFSNEAPTPGQVGPFGTIQFPYVSMGTVDSLNNFNLDELVLFSFYWRNRERYRRVADLGANLGLHSVLLSRCGYEVRAYEPDPAHFGLLLRNLALNGCASVRPTQAAISDCAGSLEFVRVLGNSTGSHLAGAKANPYGKLERFPVQVEEFGPLLEWADLVKMDIEGQEAKVLLATAPAQWQRTDAVMEIGSPANAQAVFEHFRNSAVHLFAQKGGWNPVQALADMPTSHRDGSLFLTCKHEMPWGANSAASAAA